MGAKYEFFFDNVVGCVQRQTDGFMPWWSCWSSSYNSGLYQGVFSRSTPQESDSGSANSTRSTHW